MPYKSLRSFVEKLEQEDELVRVKEFVNPVLEITEITDRFSKLPGGGKALLFENTGTAFPVLTNAMGSYKRICLALGTNNLDSFGFELNDLLKKASGEKNSLVDKLKLLPILNKVGSWMPKRISGRGICQEVVISSPDLSILPILKCWPADGGRFVTFPLVHTVDPNSGIRNLGMYRMQVFGKDLTGMHWHRHKTGARHYDEYKKFGKKMPVAVALGGDPVYTYSATAPLPDQMDEYMLAGFLRKKQVELVKCITQDIDVPYDADIIIEGYVDPAEDLIWEGPFGDHTGFYSLEDWYPRFHVTCITHRRDAIYPATIVGVPPQEDAWIAKATERIFLMPMRLSLAPEIIDLDMPPAGVAHNLALVKIEKRYPGQGLKVINSLWGAGQMMFNKVMVVSDDTTDIHDYKKLFRRVILNLDIPGDLMFGKGPLDVLDHSADKFAFGGKLGIDATGKLPEENALQVAAHLEISKIEIAMKEITGISKFSLKLIKEGIPVLLFALTESSKANLQVFYDYIRKQEYLNEIKVFVCFNSSVDLDDYELCAFLFFNNIDPVRDCIVFSRENSIQDFIGVDASVKSYQSHQFPRPWPNIVCSSPETIAIIDKNWSRYFNEKIIPSPSLNYQHLSIGSGAVAFEKVL
jgi:4-hydroxy-3-polyprenylbenzoate decarboxylase